jgi:hypothetical protein
MLYKLLALSALLVLPVMQPTAPHHTIRASSIEDRSRAVDDTVTLIGVSIKFVTHDDDKDDDTKLNVSVKSKTNQFLSQDIAEGDNLGGDMQFVDPSTHEFNLVLESSTTKLKDLAFPFVNIDIQPHGNDTWIFDYTVTLRFSDGRTFSSTERGVVLDQNNKHHTGVFQS